MTKERDDQEIEEKKRDDQEHEQDEEGGDDQNVETSEKDGKLTVEVHHETKLERRTRIRREQQQQLIREELADGVTKPLLDQIQALTQRVDSFQRQYAPQQQNEPQPKQHGNAFRDKLAAEYEKQAMLVESIRTTQDPSKVEVLRGKYMDSVYAVEELRQEEAVARNRSNQPAPQESAELRRLRSRFADVFSHPAGQAALIHAKSQFDQTRVLAEHMRRPFDGETEETKALEEAAYIFGIRQRPSQTPSKGQQARFAGAAPTGTGGGGPVTRQLTEQEIGIATATYPDVPVKEAVAAWTKQVAARGYFNR